MLLKGYLRFFNAITSVHIANFKAYIPRFVFSYLFLAFVHQQVYRLRFFQGSRMCFSAYFQLMDISGKAAMEQYLIRNRQKMDISAETAGTYLYMISNPKELEETGKLVVE